MPSIIPMSFAPLMAGRTWTFQRAKLDLVSFSVTGWPKVEGRLVLEELTVGGRLFVDVFIEEGSDYHESNLGSIEPW